MVTEKRRFLAPTFDVQNYMLVADKREGPVKEGVWQFLRNGGSEEMDGDYSVTPTPFIAQPPVGEVWRIRRILIFVSGAGPYSADDYGPITGGLTNGILVRVRDDDAVIKDLTDGVPFTTNSDIRKHCYDMTPDTFGAGLDSVAARWTVEKSGTEVRLIGDNNERIEALLNDDFTGIAAGSHTMKVDGWIE